MGEEREAVFNVKKFRKIIISADDLLHFSVAIVLIVCAAVVLVRGVLGYFAEPGMQGVLHVLNDVLLCLIVLEILWPVVRFLKRLPFRLAPFFYVGIISATRRILLIEAEHSLADRTGHSIHDVDWPVMIELGVNVLVILLLSIAFRVVVKPVKESGDEGH